jgi:hypothetical protein
MCGVPISAAEWQVPGFAGLDGESWQSMQTIAIKW